MRAYCYYARKERIHMLMDADADDRVLGSISKTNGRYYVYDANGYYSGMYFYDLEHAKCYAMANYGWG